MEITSLNYLSEHLKRLIKGRLWLQVIIGLVLGSGLGIILNPDSGYLDTDLSAQLAAWLDLPGQVFMKLVQMVMIPLIFTSIISGIISNNSDQLRSMGFGLLLYFVATTFISIAIGAILVQLFKPGKMVFELGGFPGAGGESVASEALEKRPLPETISGLIPDNPLEAMLTGEMLGVVIFTVIIGLAVTQLAEHTARPIVKVVEAIQKICMIVVSWAMQLVPFAVFGLMAALLSRIGWEAVLGLTYFIGVVLLGLLVLFLIYMLILILLARKNPGTFLKAVRDAQLLAFSTASSAAVMPLSMKIADEKLGVSSSISDFVIPVGASINMDGTALFQCVTAIFIAQAYGIEMAMPALIMITFTIVGASIGTPAIPGGGVIILASVLQGAGIPTEGLIVVIGVDRILGMFRTAVNVTGDLVACTVFDRWYG